MQCAYSLTSLYQALQAKQYPKSFSLLNGIEKKHKNVTRMYVQCLRWFNVNLTNSELMIGTQVVGRHLDCWILPEGVFLCLSEPSPSHSDA